MQLIRNISIFLAAIILLLHSVLSHEHHSQLSEMEHVSQHEAATDLLDFIKLSFHVDQGDGHLEKYQLTDANFSFVAELNEVLIVVFQPKELSQVSFPCSYAAESLHSSFLQPQLRFRGPPYLA